MIKKNSYLTIANELVKDIYDNKLKPNSKLPSEAQITIKYNVSRIVASKVFSELSKIGAVYSIPKKGYFVSEVFSGMIKPISYEYDIDRIETKLKNIETPELFKLKNIRGQFKTGVKKFYKNNELIIDAQFFIAGNVPINIDNLLIDEILKRFKKTTATTFLRFENFDSFGNKINLVNTKVVYGDRRILLVERYVVKKEYFKLEKQEFSL